MAGCDAVAASFYRMSYLNPIYKSSTTDKSDDYCFVSVAVTFNVHGYRQ
jgi:hypothetical protein